jgi:hypothetical protein
LRLLGETLPARGQQTVVKNKIETVSKMITNIINSLEFKDFIGPIIVFAAVVFSIIPEFLKSDSVFKKIVSKILIIIIGFCGLIVGLNQVYESKIESNKIKLENNDRKLLLSDLKEEVLKTRFNNDSLTTIIFALKDQLIFAQEKELEYRQTKEKLERKALIYQAIIDLNCYYHKYLELDKKGVLGYVDKKLIWIMPCNDAYLKRVMDINLRWFDRRDLNLIIQSIDASEKAKQEFEENGIKGDSLSLRTFLRNRDAIVELSKNLMKELDKYYIK